MGANDNPFEKAVEIATKTIIQEIYNDIKEWAMTAVRPMQRTVRNIKKKKYSNIAELNSDISKRNLKNGDYIQIKCKFSSFGISKKPIYIGPLAGMNTQNRLGPPLLNNNPVLGMMAQMTSNLSPIGIYPYIDENITQVKLYPHDSSAFGFFGMMPDIHNLVPSFNALIKTEFLNEAHKVCTLTGKLRCITQKDLVDAGYPLEEYEVLRSLDNIWFLQAVDNESDCKVKDNSKTELWGALYSGGHLEFDGELPIKPLIDNYINSLSPHVEDLKVIQNQAKNKEVNIFGKGFRMVQHINFPLYALHYDIDIGTNYIEQKKNYDNILNTVFESINKTCDDNSVELKNPNDLDFHYTNQTNNHKLLASKAAENIDDPLAMAIREWIKDDK